MPLDRRVEFKARLQKGNRVQLPKPVRWRYKLETDQTLKVGVTVANMFCGWESFFARMDKSGRITIPKFTLKQLGNSRPNMNLKGVVFKVLLEPA